MNNNIKSATTAGLLGIFLGSVGAHNWYLGDKKKGTLHVIVFGAGVFAIIVADVILPSVVSFWTLYRILWLISLLSWGGALAMSASGLWGLIEGVQIMAQGDVGLAQKGYRVATGMQNFGGQNGMNNQMGNQMGNPMNGQMNQGHGQNNGQNGQWGNGYNG